MSNSTLKMNRNRKSGTALPPGQCFTLDRNDFMRSSFYSNVKHDETYGEENNAGQSPKMVRTKNLDRRSSACSMTLPLGPERRRKYSFQIGRMASNIIQGLAVQHDDIESHFAVILGSPSVGKTGEGGLVED